MGAESEKLDYRPACCSVPGTVGGAGRGTGILRTLPHAVSTLPLPSGLRSLTSHLPGVLTIVPRQGLTGAHVPWWLPAPLFQEGGDANKEALFFSDGQGPREPASSPPASIPEGPSKPASSPHASIQERASSPLRPTGTPPGGEGVTLLFLWVLGCTPAWSPL